MIVISDGRAIDTDGLTEKEMNHLQICGDLTPEHQAIVEKIAKSISFAEIWGPVPAYVTDVQRPWWERDADDKRYRALKAARRAFDAIRDELQALTPARPTP